MRAAKMWTVFALACAGPEPADEPQPPVLPAAEDAAADETPPPAPEVPVEPEPEPEERVMAHPPEWLAGHWCGGRIFKTTTPRFGAEKKADNGVGQSCELRGSLAISGEGKSNPLQTHLGFKFGYMVRSPEVPNRGPDGSCGPRSSWPPGGKGVISMTEATLRVRGEDWVQWSQEVPLYGSTTRRFGQGAETVVNDAEGTETVTVERLSDTKIRIAVEYEDASGKRAAEGLQRNPSSLLPGTWEKTSDGCFK